VRASFGASKPPGLGLLCPLLDAAGKDCALSLFNFTTSFLHLGHLLIGLAGVIMLYDRTFGLSTGWMRFIETQMKLEKALIEFRLD
jgi:hypothetical protein